MKGSLRGFVERRGLWLGGGGSSPSSSAGSCSYSSFDMRGGEEEHLARGRMWGRWRVCARIASRHSDHGEKRSSAAESGRCGRDESGTEKHLY